MAAQEAPSLPLVSGDGEEFAGLVVALPTYNEADNATRLVAELREHLPGAAILVVDDGSPDGTADLVTSRFADDPLVRVLRRHAKLGLGTAYIAAFAEARAVGAEVVMTMDADFSHRPADAPSVARAVCRDGVDLSIGSRYIPGGSIVGWPPARTALSATANKLIRFALGSTINDCTGAFRAYRMDLVDRIEALGMHSTGYSALPELLLLATASGATIVEVPITFVERERGATKLTHRELIKSVTNLWRLRQRRSRLGKVASQGLVE